MTETLCDSQAVKYAAGLHANSTITADATAMTQYINQAEGDIIAETRVNWVDIYGTMNANFKQVLEGACAAKAAIKVINYDMSGFTSRGEAVTMLNVLWAAYTKAIRELKEAKNVQALGGAYIGT